MTPMPLLTLSPEDQAAYALSLFEEHSVAQGPVLEGSRLVGLLARADIVEHLHRRQQ